MHLRYAVMIVMDKRTCRVSGVHMYGCSGAVLMRWRTLSYDPHYHHLDLVRPAAAAAAVASRYCQATISRSVAERLLRLT